MSTKAFAALRDLLGPSGFLSGEDVPVRNRRDCSATPASTPLAVMRPASVQEVAAVIRICAEHHLPVVPQGGMTGLSGGAVARSDQLALSTERLRGIEALDGDTILVRAGTPLAEVHEAAAGIGMTFPIDIGSRGSCSIGGMAATNAGGYRVIRHGMMRRQVLGLEAVLADGTVVSSLRPMLKDNAGFDVKQLFIGSEGCLGVVTRVLLQLIPASSEQAMALIGARDYAAALACLASARRNLGVRLSAFEGIWPDYWDLMRERLPDRTVPLAGRHGIYLLVEMQGNEGDRSAMEGWLAECLADPRVEDGVVAFSDTQVAALWTLREGLDEFWPAAAPYGHVSFDVGVRPADIDRFISRCRKEIGAIAGATALFFGHIGDGNVHVVIGLPGDDPLAAKAHIETLVYGAIADFTGTVTAEHGVGQLKRRWLEFSRSPAEIEVMRRLKTALDPYGLFNPGKVLPDP